VRQGHDKLSIELRYVILDENGEVVGGLHEDFAAAHNTLLDIENVVQELEAIEPITLGRPTLSQPIGFCSKERIKVTIKNPENVTMKSGRPAIKGECPNCATKIFKIRTSYKPA
jgi:hypothetical protein